MFFNVKKFHYLPLSSSKASNKSNIYINPSMDIIPQSTDVPDLGIIMSKDCSFDSHISSLSRKCNNLAGWILRSFVSRDRLTMLTLFKSLVISRLDYASQLWSPHKISQITQTEKVQRSFTKHISGLRDLSYHERLQTLKLYSLQRRRERYCIILIRKIIENKFQNLSDPILCNFSDRRGRSCVISHVDTGRLGTLAYNCFRWRAMRLFNSLPKAIRDINNCSVCSFKQRLDYYFSSIPDLPCPPGFNNSLDGGDCLQRWTLRDDLVAG